MTAQDDATRLAGWLKANADLKGTPQYEKAATALRNAHLAAMQAGNGVQSGNNITSLDMSQNARLATPEELDGLHKQLEQRLPTLRAAASRLATPSKAPYSRTSSGSVRTTPAAFMLARTPCGSLMPRSGWTLSGVGGSGVGFFPLSGKKTLQPSCESSRTLTRRMLLRRCTDGLLLAESEKGSRQTVARGQHLLAGGRVADGQGPGTDVADRLQVCLVDL